MVGQRVVGVAACGGPPATRVGAGGMPDLDQVAQRRRRPVRGRLPGMVAVVACEQGDAEDPGSAWHRRPGRVGSWRPGPTGLAGPLAVTWSTGAWGAGAWGAGAWGAGAWGAGAWGTGAWGFGTWSACRTAPGADFASWSACRAGPRADSRLAEWPDWPLSVPVNR